MPRITYPRASSYRLCLCFLSTVKGKGILINSVLRLGGDGREGAEAFTGGDVGEADAGGGEGLQDGRGDAGGIAVGSD
jgi:hypothetical protein